MIQALHIINCQSIKKLTLPLGRITVLVGDTDSGKSACIRALFAFLTNTFKKNLLRTGESTFKVGIVIDNKPIGFVKGDDSHYFIGDKKFTKVGKEIPLEITKILRMPKIHFDKDLSYFLHVQGQMQPEFLVNDYGGLASKVIGKLSNLGFVYIARRKAEKERKKATQDHDSAIMSLTSALSSKEKIEAVVSEEELNSISLELQKLTNIEETLQQFNQWLSYTADASKLSALDILPELELDILSLSKIQSSLLTLNSAISTIQEFADLKTKFDSLDLDEIKDSCLKLTAIDSQLVSFSSAGKSIEDFQMLQQEIATLEKEIIASSVELDSFINTLDICRFCGQKLNPEAKRFISGN